MIESCETCQNYSYEDGCFVLDRFEKGMGITREFTYFNRNFPYHPAPGCYVVEFWMTRYADMVDGSDDSLDEAYAAFLADKKSGIWILPVVNQRIDA